MSINNHTPLNFTFKSIATAPNLPQKMRRIPSRGLDKLHPGKNGYVEYVDEGLWKSRIVFQKDVTEPVLFSKMRAGKQRPFTDLDALCEKELMRRYPHYQVITGLKAFLKNIFPNLTGLILGRRRFYQFLTQKEVNKYKKQIAYSAVNRDDVICQPKIEDRQLKKMLHLANHQALQTEHLFSKNSPLNGQSFFRDGKRVNLSQAIACSNDRLVENTGNLRVVQTKKKNSICYTGRADSDRKALEQASFIFFNELRTNGKGITRTGKRTYQLDYVANSMLSVPWLSKNESMLVPHPERQYLENEHKAFLALKKKGAITIEDPLCPRKKYQVKFNPILFSRSSNLFTRLENWLPLFVTGQAKAERISEEGFASLKQLALRKAKTSPYASKIHACLQTLEAGNLRPEEEWLVRDYLSKFLDIPCIYHCKSSTDRTSITVALSSTLRQWIDLKLPLPANITTLLNDKCFKELFAANWMAGHQITRYARGGKGTVAGEKLNNKNLGLALSRGVSQNPMIAHLLPERYFTDFPSSQKLKFSVLYLVLLLPLTILFYLPLFFVTAGRHLIYLMTGGKNHQWIGPAKFTLPNLLPTLFFDFFSIFPKKVLNERSPQVGARCLLAGGKHGGKADHD